MNRSRIKYLEKVEQSSPPEIEMRQEEAPIMVFQDGEKAIGRIHQIVDEIYAALGALQLDSADFYYYLNNKSLTISFPPKTHTCESALTLQGRLAAVVIVLISLVQRVS